MQYLNLKITSLSSTGLGVSRSDNLVVFVEGALPGDEVQAEIVDQKKNYATAHLKNILKPSPYRITPPCSVFGTCGGCQIQNLEYNEQLKQKQNIVEHALRRIANEEHAEIKNIIPSPNSFHYRNRAQFRIEGDRIGFYQKRSHTIVPFDSCALLEEPLNDEFKKLRAEFKQNPSPNQKKIEIFIDKQNGIRTSRDKSHGAEGFSQVNTLQNENLIQFVIEAVGLPSESQKDLLDLYCGSGNFSFPLNKKGWNVYGVDLNRSAIKQARTQATPTTFFSAQDCSLEVKRLAEKGRRFPVILLDPPRLGADERLWSSLVALKPEKLVYISCNPATFSRDWARLKNASKAVPPTLIKVQPFDMFPQTIHVELAAVAAFSQN